MSTGIVSRSGEEENTEGAVGVNSEVLDEGNTVSRRTQQETLKHFLRMINMPMLLELKGFPGFILNVTSSEEPFQTAMQAKVSSPPVQSIASVSAICEDVRISVCLCIWYISVPLDCETCDGRDQVILGHCWRLAPALTPANCRRWLSTGQFCGWRCFGRGWQVEMLPAQEIRMNKESSM